MIDQFILDNVFYHLPGDETKAEIYWREVAEDEEGYVIYWPESGEYHHTYKYPPDWY